VLPATGGTSRCAETYQGSHNCCYPQPHGV